MREHGRRIARAAGVAVSYAVQEEPRGTADAVLAAREFGGGDPFVLCNGDNVYPDSALSRLVTVPDDACWVVAFERDGLSRKGNIAPERVRDFAVVTVDEDGRLAGIVEKPEDPERLARGGRLWLNMNLYRFTSDIFDACADVTPDPRRGELELTAAVGLMIERGTTPFRVLRCEDGVFDLTSRSDVPAAERVLKERRLCF
jgi:dTDP-glucose pyrophosphorylase